MGFFGYIKEKAVDLFGLGFYDIDDSGSNESTRSREAWCRAYSENSRFRTPIHCIAEDLSVVKWRVFSVDKEGRRKEVTVYNAKRGSHEYKLCKLISRPHPLMSWKVWSKTSVEYLEVSGISLMIIKDGQTPLATPSDSAGPIQRRASRTPDRLEYVAPHRVLSTPSDNFGKWKLSIPVMGKDGFVAYDSRDFHPSTIFSIIRPSLLDPHAGFQSPAKSVDDEVTMDESILKWAIRTMLQGSFLGNIVTLPNLKAREEEIKKSWRNKYAGYKNAGKDYFVDAKNADAVSVTPLGRSPLDMSVVDQRIATRDMLGSAWQVPPERMGIIEDANRSTIDVADFHQQSKNVLPRLIEMREEFNYRITPFFGEHLTVDFDNPVVESQEQVLQMVNAGVKSGWIKLNEAREKFEYEPRPVCDGFAIPINNVMIFDENGNILLENPNAQTEESEVKASEKEKI